MQYTPEIQYIEKIISEVLVLLNEKPLFDNNNWG